MNAKPALTSPVDSPALEAAPEQEVTRVCKSVAELAASVFEMPLVFLKLYEGSTLVTKAVVGINSTPAGIDDMAFTQRKLIPGESLLVPDATSDGRYFLESMVLGTPKIRFYVDMPLVADGVVMGVLALAERSPRHDFGATKQALLRQFANTIATTISLAQATTERRDLLAALKAQETRFDAAQDMTGIGHFAIDLKSREVTWSRGLYGIYGISPKGYKPRVATQLDIYEQKDAALIIDRFQRAVNYGEDFDFETTIIRRKDKVERKIRTKGGVEYDDTGKPARLCAVVRDITDGGTIEIMTAGSADIDAAKSDFLAHITHELRTPLNAILSTARALNDKSVEHPDIASYSQSLLKSARALQGLVSESLDISNLDIGSRIPEQAHVRQDAINVMSLVKDVVNQFAPMAQASQTRITAHFVDMDAPFAEVDGQRLQQLLQNLVSNACKFTRGGVINVTASQIKVDERPFLRISVRDTGIGLNDEQSITAFENNGKGLGLSICKAITDLLGGHIGVVSRQGEGSNFWFEIPAQWTQVPAVSDYDTADEIMPRLVNELPRADISRGSVDQDRINREYLRALLQDMKIA